MFFGAVYKIIKKYKKGNSVKTTHILVALVASIALVMNHNDVACQQYTVRTVHGTKYLVEITSMINQAYKKVAWLKDNIKRTSVAELANIVQHPHKTLYMCLDGKKICGAALLDNADDPTKLMLEMFTVHPDYQGKNIGTLLMRFVENEAVKTYYTHDLYLYVIPCMQERLVAYYKRNGFEIISEKPYTLLSVVKPAYHDQMSLLLMRKKI